MSKITVEKISYSVGPNGIKIFTGLAFYPRFMHSEHIRHRAKGFSVASSRAIPAKMLMKQVREDPAMPVLWPKEHKGMQGTEVFDGFKRKVVIRLWLTARTLMVWMSSLLSWFGLSKQLTNRLIEPWVTTRCVFTATEFEGFFRLRHPWHYRKQKISGAGMLFEDTDETVWESEINLTFAAEYNIQQMAIECKKIMDESTPKELGAGAWHLPFIEMGDIEYQIAILGNKAGSDECYRQLVKISAARCAMTSYNRNKGRSIETELELADRLMADRHWSPFEHQAMAIKGNGYVDVGCDLAEDLEGLDEAHVKSIVVPPKGMELRINDKLEGELWSRNFRGWCQGRALLE